MIKSLLQKAFLKLKLAWHMTPAVFHAVRTVTTEYKIYQARRRTANFNSLLLWKEIVG